MDIKHPHEQCKYAFIGYSNDKPYRNEAHPDTPKCGYEMCDSRNVEDLSPPCHLFKEKDNSNG